MNDMSGVIVPKSDQINADDFIAGPQTITIRDVQIRGGQEQPVSIFFNGSEKAFRPCKSMSRVLVHAWGADAKLYIGRSLTLYRDPTVKWGGLEVGGIRISHMSNIEGKLQMQLTATKGQRRPHVVMPLLTQQRPAGDVDGILQGIGDCRDQAALREFWKQNSETIPDEQYDRVLAAFNARLAEVKNGQTRSPTQPATGPLPAEAEPPNTPEEVADSGQQGEGPADEQRGEIITLASAKEEIDACEFVPDVNTRVSALLPLLSEEDGDALRSHALAKIEAPKGYLL